MSQDEQKQEQPSEETAEKIELDVETYQALLDRLDDLESQTSKKTGNVIKDLASEGRDERPSKREEQVDLDSLSQSQLAEYIINQVGAHVLHPLSVEMQGLKLELELKDLERDETYGPLYKENKDRAFEIATENPKLSMRQAVDLAAKESGKKKESETSEKKTRDSKLRHLPTVPHSERPGRSASTMTREEPKDRKSAAERAMEEMGIDFDKPRM